MAQHIDRRALETALEEAEGWAEHGYSERSKAYWSGMRDTLRVLLGVTTEPPQTTGPESDAAAGSILRAQRQFTSKA